MRCGGLHKLADPAYLSPFLFSALPCVAPYCARGGIRVVSGVRELRVAASLRAPVECLLWSGGLGRSPRAFGDSVYDAARTG